MKRKAFNTVFGCGGVLFGAGMLVSSKKENVEWKEEGSRIVVIGGGVMGSSSAYHAALQPNLKVLLLDESHPVRGSWGETRAVHTAVDDPVYHAMCSASLREWLRLERLSNQHFLHPCKRVCIGPEANIKNFASKLLSLGEPVRVLGAEEQRALFPQVRVPAGERAFLSPNGYTIECTAAVEALQTLARRAGADLRLDTPVLAIDREKKVVHTQDESFPYDKLVLTCGPWTNKMLKLAGLRLLPIIVSCEQTINIKPDPKLNDPEVYDWNHLPLISYSTTSYRGFGKEVGKYFYSTPGRPGKDGSMKFGYHRQGPILDTPDFILSPEGREGIAKLNHVRKTPVTTTPYNDFDKFSGSNIFEFVRGHFPGLREDYEYFFRCLYTNTVDKDYIVGPHPEDDNVVICAAFNGGGFKDGAGLGDLVQCIITGKSVLFHPTELKKFLTRWSPKRFFEKGECED